MSLSDYTPERVDILYKGKTLIEVRGLNLEDVSFLVRRHLAELRALRAFILARNADPEKLLPNDIDAAILNLLVSAPLTAATMIALAADDLSNVTKALALPMPLQMKILLEVVRLTFEDVGGPLAFADMVGAVLRGMIAALPTVTATIQ